MGLYPRQGGCDPARSPGLIVRSKFVLRLLACQFSLPTLFRLLSVIKQQAIFSIGFSPCYAILYRYRNKIDIIPITVYYKDEVIHREIYELCRSK
jgi:hypothetical protein